jgi:hypothetical protein
MLEQTENRGLDFETPFGDTPLTKASQIGNVEMLALLIGRAHADGSFFMSDFVNYETCRGKTALSEAAKANQPEAIKFLVEKRAKIDYKTKFYRKTAIDWAANMKNEEALDELKRAYKVIMDILVLFVKIAMGDYEFCKKMVQDGEHYRLNHVKTIQEDIKQAHDERILAEAEVKENEEAIVKLTPEVEHIHVDLENNEIAVADIEQTADRLMITAKDLAGRLQSGFSNAIIALQQCGVAEVAELVNAPNPPEEIMQVVKALCLLKNIKPVMSAQLKAQEKLPPSMRRPASREAGGSNMAELHAYVPSPLPSPSFTIHSSLTPRTVTGRLGRSCFRRRTCRTSCGTTPRARRPPGASRRSRPRSRRGASSTTTSSTSCSWTSPSTVGRRP